MKKQLLISKRSFKVSYLRRSRKLYHRYLEAKPWVRLLYRDLLEFGSDTAPRRLVDVGCGTGEFTRFLASLVPRKCRIVGVDIRSASLKNAVSETRRAGLSNQISYKKGDAYDIPIGENFADLTCCRTLLMHLTDPLRAVTEMSRITRLGGIVAAVEPGRMRSFYDPNHTELTELDEDIGQAYLKGMQKLEGKEFGIGEQLPSIFHEAGLKELRVEILADAWTPCDTRLKKGQVKAIVEFWYRLFKEGRKEDRRILLAAGIAPGKINAYFRSYEEWFHRLLANEEKLRTRTSIVGSTSFVVVGRKMAPPCLRSLT